MKRRISKLLVIVIVICCAFCGCGKKLDPEKYTSYKCYDYHLATLKTKSKSAMNELLMLEEKFGNYHRPYISI